MVLGPRADRPTEALCGTALTLTLTLTLTPSPSPSPQPLSPNPNPNPNQAVGRIRRYGQQRTVQLYRLLVDATIDTDIFLERRGAEAEALLQATDQPIEPMDED